MQKNNWTQKQQQTPPPEKKSTLWIQQIILYVRSTVSEIVWYSIAIMKIIFKNVLKIMSQQQFYSINNLKDMKEHILSLFLRKKLNN